MVEELGEDEKDFVRIAKRIRSFALGMPPIFLRILGVTERQDI
jgi:hypothetical protein